MDYGLGFGDESEGRENLAVGNFARPRLRQPMVLRQEEAVSKGSVFEVDDGDEEFDIFDDGDGEYYDDDTYTMFQSYVPASTTLKVMDADKNDEQVIHHFDMSQNVAADFDEIEAKMEKLNEEGTVMKEIIRAGNGLKIPDRCRIYYHYMAVAEGQDAPFDISLGRKFPNSTDLRHETDLLPGFEMALRSMEIQEVARFVVDPVMAYGLLGCPPRIPQNTKILYVIETLQYIDEARLETPFFMSADERSHLSFETIYEVGLKLRTEGNGWYVNQGYQLAIKKYRKGIQMLEEYPCANPEDCDQRSELLHTLYANLAQSYLKLEKPAQACNACKFGLKLVRGKKSVKLIYRFAKAKLMLRDCDAALGLVKDGLKIDHNDPHLLQLEKEIRNEDAEQRKAIKALWFGILDKK